MKNYLLLFGAIFLFMLSGCQRQAPAETSGLITQLPDSFTLNLYKDETSSSGGREYNASLTFKNNNLISGWQKYTCRGGVMCKSGYVLECLFNEETNSWKDKNNQICSDMWGNFREYNSSSKDEFQEMINLGKLIPYETTSCHLRLCYLIK